MAMDRMDTAPEMRLCCAYAPGTPARSICKRVSFGKNSENWDLASGTLDVGIQPLAETEPDELPQ